MLDGRGGLGMEETGEFVVSYNIGKIQKNESLSAMEKLGPIWTGILSIC